MALGSVLSATAVAAAATRYGGCWRSELGGDRQKKNIPAGLIKV
jgi:hypothetical protein